MLSLNWSSERVISEMSWNRFTVNQLYKSDECNMLYTKKKKWQEIRDIKQNKWNLTFKACLGHVNLGNLEMLCHNYALTEYASFQ